MTTDELSHWWRSLTKVERAILTINYELWRLNFKEGTGYLKFDRIDARKTNWDSPWTRNAGAEVYNVKGWLIRWDSPWAAYEAHFRKPFNINNFTSPPLADLVLMPKLNVSCKKSVHNIASLRLILGFEQLKELRCGACQLDSFSGIENLKQLELLEAGNNNISDLTPLTSCENLLLLNIDNNLVSDLTPLRACFKLNILHCNRNKISDLSPLVQLQNLHTIHCQSNQITDVSSLSSMAKLVYFDYINNDVRPFIPPSAPHIGPHLENWQLLLAEWWKKLTAQQRSLLAINLAFADGHRELPNDYPYNIFAHYKATFQSEFEYLLTKKVNINKLLKLRKLNISLAPFAGLATEQPQIDSIDFIAPLLFSLQELVCDFNQISDFSGLARAKELLILRCDCNPIGNNIAQIAKIPNLVELHCNDANLVQLAPLRYLSSLECVFCADNQIPKAELLYLQKYLPHCDIYV